MKKIMTLLCVLSLLTCCLPSAWADAPFMTVEDKRLMVQYINSNAKGKFTYVLLDNMDRPVLVEVNADEIWTPDWTEEGWYKVKVYYKDKKGNTLSDESALQEVRFGTLFDDTYWQDFLEDNNDFLPSGFTQPMEYNDPTPAPVQTQVTQDQNPSDTLVYTFTPSQPYDTLESAQPVPTAAPAVPQQVAYPGTRPCFEHMNIRIRISDNDQHEATKGRSGPGTDMPQVATLNIGEVYQVLDCRILELGNVHWFMVDKNGVLCWVASGRCERY